VVSGDFTGAADDPSGVVGDVLADAKACGIGRVVLLSSQGVATRPDSPSHGIMGRSIEEAVRRSGIDWTILRPGGFASNAYAWAESIRTRRTAAAPFGDVGLPLIDPTTPRQRAEAIGEAIGEPVLFVEQTREEARAQMLRFMPEPVVDTTLAIIGEPTPAERRVSPDVERVLGRAPRSFADWARSNAAAFR
jgi:uncharacterized protein YbjT (DUF2867 family)